jgi:hypothetical protein
LPCPGPGQEQAHQDLHEPPAAVAGELMNNSVRSGWTGWASGIRPYPGPRWQPEIRCQQGSAYPVTSAASSNGVPSRSGRRASSPDTEEPRCPHAQAAWALVRGSPSFIRDGLARRRAGHPVIGPQKRGS